MTFIHIYLYTKRQVYSNDDIQRNTFTFTLSLSPTYNAVKSWDGKTWAVPETDILLPSAALLQIVKLHFDE